MIILILISVILVYIIYNLINKESFLNLRDSHKKTIKKCCEDCLDKPKHLRSKDCPEISNNARKNLMKHYKQMYSNEEYNEIKEKLLKIDEDKNPKPIDERIKLNIKNEARERLYRGRVKPYSKE